MRRLALLGAAQGPCVSAKGIHRPHLKVTGLPEGGTVTAKIGDEIELIIQENGVHLLSETELQWVEVRCCVSKRHMTVCEIISVKAA
jgi:hypothetical protein